MKELLKYGGISTKIRGMDTCLLSEDSFQTIASFYYVREVLAYIKELPWYGEVFKEQDVQGNLTRSVFEVLVRKVKYDTFISLYRFGDVQIKQFLKLYVRNYEVEIIRELLDFVRGSGITPAYLMEYEYFFDRYSILDLKKLYRAGNIYELIEALNGTPYYTVLRQVESAGTEELYEYDRALDRFLFLELWKRLEKVVENEAERKNMRKVLGTRIDLLNLSWIKRARHYYFMKPAEVCAILLPVTYRLNKTEIRALTEAAGPEEFRASLAGTCYGNAFASVSEAEFYDACDRIPARLLEHLAEAQPCSITFVCNHLVKKEIEIHKLTIACECVRYHIPLEDAMHYITAI